MERENDSRHVKSKKKKNRGINFGLVIILIIIAIGVFIALKNNSNKDRLAGEWTTDGVTIYEFDGNGNGVLKVPLSEYKFTYVLGNDKIYIDFESYKATDSDYEYTLENDILTLKGIKGTTGIYTLIKK